MTGKLINIDQEWFVEYDKNGEKKIYELSPESLLWVKRYDVDKILNENREVEFSLVVKGEYCETKEMMIKNYFAKLVLINFDTIY
jgi:rRNA pseudouridine-1189 N-methylase Emg1 (Nep1/Mra1 family)